MKRNLRLMSAMIFLISVGEGLTAPAIPLLGKSWGAGYWELGLLMTGYGLAYTVMTMIAGHISDHFGRKIMLSISLGLSVASSFGYVCAGSMFLLSVSRIVEGASRGILWPVSEAAIADHAESGNPGRAMGTFSAAYGLGVTMGTLIGGVVMANQGFAVFAYYPALSTVAFILISFGFVTGHQSGKGRISRSPNWVMRRQILKRLWPIGFIGFAYGGFLYSIWALLSASANEFGVQPAGIGALFGLFWGLRTVSFIISRGLIDSRGSRLTLLTGLVLCTAGAGMLLVARTFALLLITAFLSGAGTGLLFPTVLVLVMDRTTPDNHGFGMGFLELLIGLGMVGQTAVTGFLGQWRGQGWMYFSIFVGNVIALFVGVAVNQSQNGTIQS